MQVGIGIVAKFRAAFIPDLMEKPAENAVRAALEEFFATHLERCWPAAYDAQRNYGNSIELENVAIVVLSLDRIGAPAGASGASVYIAYYTDCGDVAEHPRLIPSPPVVVKVGKSSSLKTEAEQSNLWPTLTPKVRSRFAFPTDFYDEYEDYAVLLAPFSSDFKPHCDGSRLDVNVDDIWQRIMNVKEVVKESGSVDYPPKGWQEVSKHIIFALDTVDNAHRAGLASYARENSNYIDHYDWYLRNTNPEGGHDNAQIPRKLFGMDEEVSAFGRKWPNPCNIVNTVLSGSYPFDAAVGPIHGDLHPKNIVLDDQDTVQIIDFGWAQKRRHIVIDYLLLDINIRAITLPSHLLENEILEFANYLYESQSFNDLPKNVRHRGHLVHDAIWSGLRNRQVVNDWDTEYIIPLFLVSYGLIVHLDSARNQTALNALVLTTAKCVSDYIFKRRK